MRILDKYKDYYDFFGHISEDKTLVYDRRGSTPLTLEQILYHLLNGRYRYHYNDVLYFGLHVGFKLFILEVTNLQIDTDKKTGKVKHASGDIGLVDSIDNFNWKGKPLQLVHLRKPVPKYQSYMAQLRRWDQSYQSQLKIDPIMQVKDDKVTNELLAEKPLLLDTGIPALIPPFEIYKNLEVYFSASKTEKTVDIATNNEKIVNHGFDMKSSFRHPVR